jgi:hypothetical protein
MLLDDSFDVRFSMSGSTVSFFTAVLWNFDCRFVLWLIAVRVFVFVVHFQPLD